MARFSSKGTRPAVRQKGATTTGQTTTYEGGKAWTRDNKWELTLFAAVNMVGNKSFYESADDRDKRFRGLVRSAAIDDYEWTKAFIGWLRDGANMRTASAVAACEAIKARLDAKLVPAGRELIPLACKRADEPSEVLGYWTSMYGRALPKPVKRGIADAVKALYNERNFHKYDSAEREIRFADVLEMTHPSPAPNKPWQGELFEHIIDERHGRGGEISEALPMSALRKSIMTIPKEDRRAFAKSEEGRRKLADAGITWEAMSGWIQGPLDADFWEAAIPQMGTMALIRNLRNFAKANISASARKKVCAAISDEENIRKSKIFPYQIFSAEKALEDDAVRHYATALDEALDASCSNVPQLDGHTLIVVDTSMSMTGTVSERSKVRYVDVAALFAFALAVKGNDVDLYGFADGLFHHEVKKNGSVLAQANAFTKRVGEVGMGTQTIHALVQTFDPAKHKRAVVITDGQAFGRFGASYGWASRNGGYQRTINVGGKIINIPESVSEAIPANVPLFGIDAAGYSQSTIDTSQKNRYEISGFSDSMFKLIELLARGRDAGFPWEA